MKKLAYFLAGVFFISQVTLAFAAPNCGNLGQDPCTIGQIGTTVKDIGFKVLLLAGMVLPIIIVIWVIKFIYSKNKAEAKKEANYHLIGIVTGFVLIAGAFTFFPALLKGLGVKEQFLQFFNLGYLMVDHAYAAGENFLEGPTTVTDPYDFILLLISLIVRWFVYPAVIFAWVYAGFLFVKAQGNPQELKDARAWVWWTLIGTVIILLANGLAFALRETITKIFS